MTIVGLPHIYKYHKCKKLPKHILSNNKSKFECGEMRQGAKKMKHSIDSFTSGASVTAGKTGVTTMAGLGVVGITCVGKALLD